MFYVHYKEHRRKILIAGSLDPCNLSDKIAKLRNFPTHQRLMLRGEELAHGINIEGNGIKEDDDIFVFDRI